MQWSDARVSVKNVSGIAGFSEHTLPTHLADWSVLFGLNNLHTLQTGLSCSVSITFPSCVASSEK